MAEVTVNGNTYNDGSTTGLYMGNGGFRTNLIEMLSDSVTDLAAKVAAAQLAETNAETAETNAEAAAVATAADRVQTGLDVISTAADRVQTGLDVISTAADVISAATSETNAASAAPIIKWVHSTNTTMADPTSGYIRLNNATLASVTAIAVDDLNSSAQDVSAFVLTWDDSTSTVKGTLTLRQGTVYAIYTVTGLTDNAGWTELAVTHVSSGGSFANATLSFVAFSAKGDIGTGDISGPGSSTAGNFAAFTDTSGKIIGEATNASQVEMEAGTEAALRAMSPLRVAQAISALAPTGITTAEPITTSTTLTSASAGYQYIAMTTMGQSITLPDATTMTVGAPKYYFDNTNGTYPAGIRNKAGTLLMAIGAGGGAWVSLESIAALAGVWGVTGTNLEPGLITIDNTFSSTYASTVLKPFVALDDNKSIHFLKDAANSIVYAVAVDDTTGAVGTPLAITGDWNYTVKTCFKITSTAAIVFTGDSNNLNGMVVSLSGATTLAVGSTASSGANTNIAVEDFSGAPKIAQLDTTHYLVSWATATGAGNTSVMAAEVTSGTTVTFGSKADIITSNNVVDSTTTYALTATTAAVAYLEGASAPYTHKVAGVSVSGTTCNVNATKVSAGTYSQTNSPATCQLSDTKLLIGSDANAGNHTIHAVTLSGSTPSVGAALTVETGISVGLFSYTASSATRYNPHLFPLSASTALLWYFDSGSVSRAVVLSESGGTVTGGAIAYASISNAAANLQSFGVILPQGTNEFLSVFQTLASTAGFGLQFTTHKISGTSLTSGVTKSLRNISQVVPTSVISARLSGGDYVIASGVANSKNVTCTLPVIRSNGDAINYRGEITCPPAIFANGAYPIQSVSSNRIVLLGYQTISQLPGGAERLRLLNLEVAA